MDWASIIAEEAKTSTIFRSDSLAKKYRIPLPSTLVALKRQEKRGLVKRIGQKVYINNLAAGFNIRDLASAIRPESYISLDSALHEWGISSQSPVALTCIGLKQNSQIKADSVQIEFHTIKKSLFWGFQSKKTRYSTYQIAEPEKALLDWIYLRRKENLPIDLDEFQLQLISRSKLVTYAQKYPTSTLNSLYPVLAERQFSA
jgi:predicted transcriptional regulator of viral defense system